MAPGADLRKDLSLENEMYWFKRQRHVLPSYETITLPLTI